jgi:NTE family protein
MGSVIHLSPEPLKRGEARPAAADGGKTALVLGGGGITGAAYHLGVLNAMNAMGPDVDVNDFDLYVGTSAGAVVAACLANGITPEELILANVGHSSASIPGIGADEIMMPDRRGLARSLIRWPLGVIGALRRYVGHPFTTRLIDGLGALAEGLPAGPLHDRRHRALPARSPRPAGPLESLLRDLPPAPDLGDGSRQRAENGVR